MILLTNAIEWEVRRKRKNVGNQIIWRWWCRDCSPSFYNFTFSYLKFFFRNTSENLLIYTKVYIRGSSYSTFSCNQNDNLIFFPLVKQWVLLLKEKGTLCSYCHDVSNSFVRWILFSFWIFIENFVNLETEKLKGMHLKFSGSSRIIHVITSDIHLSLVMLIFSGKNANNLKWKEF